MTTFNSIFKKWALSLLVGLCLITSANAQIGYQISLLNTATGEARANETVNVTATITDSSGGVIYTGTQSATSNDFGVLSLSVGDADTFTNLDLQQHRLPFFIEVSANGAMISRSQILSVPVAEVARKLEPQLKLEDVVGTWTSYQYYDPRSTHIIIFTENGKMDYKRINHEYDDGKYHSFSGDYKIDGNTIYIYPTQFDEPWYSGLGIAQIHNGYLYIEHQETHERYSRLE